MSDGEIILYGTEDGAAEIQVKRSVKARKAAQALAASETDELEELKRIADATKGLKKGGDDA